MSRRAVIASVVLTVVLLIASAFVWSAIDRRSTDEAQKTRQAQQTATKVNVTAKATHHTVKKNARKIDHVVEYLVGERGLPGAPGAEGIHGAKGDQGLPGALGATGMTGPQGEPGESIIGPQGAAGEPGESITGPEGPKGADGKPGETVIGPEGPRGERGETGPQGPPGESITGPPGPQGIQGESGPPPSGTFPCTFSGTNESGEAVTFTGTCTF